MNTLKISSVHALAKTLKHCQVGVLPTDTLYGLSCRFSCADAIERIYKLKGRDRTKPLIVLIHDVGDLAHYFGIELDTAILSTLTDIWPARVSVVLPVPSTFSAELVHLHRGGSSLAFRVPAYSALRTVLCESGPIVSTTVNRSGEPACTTIAQAKKVFGKQLDFCVDIGELTSSPSTVITPDKGTFRVLREGAVKPDQYF